MHTVERVLWIDARCINQADIAERNNQLRIMPHIYNRAHMVLAWLGTAKENRTSVMDGYIEEYWRRGFG